MKLSYKTALLVALLLMGCLVVRIFLWQYEAYNERRGYCTAEGKYLSEEEKLENLKADIVVQALEKWIKDTEGEYYSRVFISKYDLSDKEKIINLMKKSNINKSFEENFGIIAVGTVSEYISRRSCLENNKNCNDYSKSRNGLRGLWRNDNTVDVEYLKSLSTRYSIIISVKGGDNVLIYPLSSIVKEKEKSYTMSYYSIYKFCCDNKMIEEMTGQTNRSTQKKTAEQIKLDYSEILALNPDRIDGKYRDSVYIMHLFGSISFYKPEIVQKYGLFWNVASLKGDTYPRFTNMLISSCGKISKIK